MTDYLADVVMPEEPVAPAESTEAEEQLLPDVAGQQLNDPEDTELELSDEEEEEEIIVEPVKKEKISQEEIFAPKVLPVVKPKQVRKKGRVMTQKQLDALAKAREKGIETRRRNAAEKKKMKELEKEEKRLLKEQKVNKFNKLKKAVEEEVDDTDRNEPPPAAVKVVEKERIVEKGYSQEQLDAAVSEAVERSVNRVEVLRKERKAVKKKAQAKEQHDAKVFKEINSALKKPDVWDSCFM